MIGLEEIQNLFNDSNNIPVNFTPSAAVTQNTPVQPHQNLLKNLLGGVGDYFGSVGNSVVTGLKNPNIINSLNQFGASALQGNSLGESMATGFNTYQKSKDATRLGEMYNPILNNLGVDLTGKNFRTPEELNSYVKTANEIERSKESNDLRKLYYGILAQNKADKVNRPLQNDKSITLSNLMNISPSFKNNRLRNRKEYF